MENTSIAFYNKIFWRYFAVILILAMGFFLVKEYPKTLDNSIKNKAYFDKRFKKIAEHFPNRIGNLSLIHYDVLGGMETDLITHSSKHQPVMYVFLFVLLPFFIFRTFTASYLLHILLFSFSFTFGLRTLHLITKRQIYPLIAFVLFSVLLNHAHYIRPALLMVDHFFAYFLLIILSLLLGIYHKIFHLEDKKTLTLLIFSLFSIFVSRNGGYLFYIPSFAFLFFLFPSRKQFNTFALILLNLCVASSLAVNFFTSDSRKVDINIRTYAVHLALKVYQEHPLFFTEKQQEYLEETMPHYTPDNLDDVWYNIDKTWINDKNTFPLIFKLWFHFPLITLKEAFGRNYALWHLSNRHLRTQTVIPISNHHNYIKEPPFNYVGLYFWTLLAMALMLSLFFRMKVPLFILFFFLPFTAVMAVLVPIATTRYFYYFQFCGAFLVSYFLFLLKNHKTLSV